MKSQVVKRSVGIDGHRTSISLEDAFWSNLKAIAQAQGATVAQTGHASRAICPPRSVCLSSTESAMDKWVSRSRAQRADQRLRQPSEAEIKEPRPQRGSSLRLSTVRDHGGAEQLDPRTVTDHI